MRFTPRKISVCNYGYRGGRYSYIYLKTKISKGKWNRG